MKIMEVILNFSNIKHNMVMAKNDTNNIFNKINY